MVLIIVVIMGVFGFANIFPAISITVRRLRDVGLSGWFLFAVWLFSVVLGNVDNAFFEGLMAALEIVVLVFMFLPSNYINKQGWWSPNKDNDQEIPSLRNEN